MVTVKAPDDDCPKCGEPAAFAGSRPRYGASGSRIADTKRPVREWLEWTCRRCGFVLEGPVAAEGGVSRATS